MTAITVECVPLVIAMNVMVGSCWAHCLVEPAHQLLKALVLYILF